MSISVALVPLAIAAMPVLGVMRLTMGKEKFEAWMDADIVRFYTNFRNRNELTVAVKKAGYDAAEWGGTSIKTHIDKEMWFFWEIHKNCWTMRIHRNDDKAKIKQFMRAVEEKNHRQIFVNVNSKKEVGNKPVTKNATVQPQRILPEVESALPTIYTDQTILLKTLQQYGVKDVQVQQDTIFCVINGYKLKYYRERAVEGVPYQLSVKSRNDLRKLYAEINSLNEGYQSNVQEQVYVNVKKKLEEKQAVIETEEIMDDNSILLTVNI